MRDRYVGDVGDFGKYRLLKALCGDDLSFGVVWYLVPDEAGNADGGHIGWTRQEPRFMPCDPALFHVLYRMIERGDRSVRAVRERGVLPRGTVFYEDPLSYAGMPGWGRTAIGRRLEHRKAWAWDALAATRGCDVVFADPDNGLEPRAGLPRQRLNGPKHAYFDELSGYLDRGQSVVVYHHLHRGAPHDRQVQDRLAQVEERLGSCFAMWYRPGSGRVFFVVPAEAHRRTLRQRAERLARNPCWCRHFTLDDPR